MRGRLTPSWRAASAIESVAEAGPRSPISATPSSEPASATRQGYPPEIDCGKGYGITPLLHINIACDNGSSHQLYCLPMPFCFESAVLRPDGAPDGLLATSLDRG